MLALDEQIAVCEKDLLVMLNDLQITDDNRAIIEMTKKVFGG